MKKARSINKKHHKITRDYEKQKSKHVEKLADKMLENDKKSQQWQEKSNIKETIEEA